ncbi:MAG: tyrosine-protein phosphatase [Bacteroidia bacterium]
MNDADLSVLHCDMHSHFIPGIDDGAKTMADTLEMLRGMEDFGYKKIITTPHIMGDYYRNTPEIILGGLEQVREAAKKEGINLELEAAAEYYFDFDLEQKLNSEKLLTFGKNYLLFEVSYLNAPENLDGLIFKMQTQGYKPILAHPERYPFWYNSFETYERLRDKGVLFQLNINSLTGYYSPATKKIAERMIDERMIDFLGSDCHHLGHQKLMQQVRNNPHLHKLLASGLLKNNLL